MVGVALQVVGLVLVAVGLWMVHTTVFCVIVGAALVMAPHVLADPGPGPGDNVSLHHRDRVR